MPDEEESEKPSDPVESEWESGELRVFNAKTRTWEGRLVEACIDAEPFAEGTFRVVYKAVIKESDGTFKSCVAKRAKDLKAEEIVYRNDVEAQQLAKLYAEEFNKYKIPYRIEFIDASILVLSRPEGPHCFAIEEQLEGVFEKHNNNFGEVSQANVGLERYAPQTFSHFTYELSRHRLLICDVQGVVGKYTDPQVHTLDGKGFGAGNLGEAGINAFLRTHKCNPACVELGLPNAGRYLVTLTENQEAQDREGRKAVPLKNVTSYIGVLARRTGFDNEATVLMSTGKGIACKQRYILLKDTFLISYKDKQNSKPRVVLPLEYAMCNAVAVHPVPGADKTPRFWLLVEHSGYFRYYIAFDDPDTRNKWVKAIKSAKYTVQKLQVDKATRPADPDHQTGPIAEGAEFAPHQLRLPTSS